MVQQLHVNYKKDHLNFHDMIKRNERIGDQTISYYNENYINGKTIQYEIVDGIWGVYHDLVLEVSEIYNAEVKGVIKMNYCVSGRCEFHYKKNKIIYLGAGDFIVGQLEDNYERHQFPFRNYSGFSIITTEGKLDAFLDKIFPESKISAGHLIEKMNQNGAFLISGNDPKIHNIIEEMFITNMSFKKERAMLKLAELILYLIDDDMIVGDLKGRYFEQHLIHKIKKIKRDVTENVDDYVKIKEISEKYGVSPRSFSECFKAVYGKTYYAFIKEFRVKKAAEMLRTTNDKISDIAMLVGYQNASKFSKAFSDVMGITPLTFRNNHFTTVLE
ncbi:helix-turn-helix domain-containing protein [Wukongibacter sp. M2B1]|uniref:helix-turn-helix domain-containing protein n=1 Tax=Wukongibacter sp. M2B1 TaxID=3088895 RepID=UPI003D7BC111